MPIGYAQKTFEILFSFRSSLHGEKVDDLNQQLCVTTAGFSNSVHKFSQAGNKPVVSNPQQRPAGNVSNASRLNHQSCRLSGGESAVPIKISLRDESIFSRAPGNHCRDPRARLEHKWTESDRCEY